MSKWFVPGRVWQRIVAVVLLPVALRQVWHWWQGGAALWLTILVSIAAFMFTALSIPPLYAAWLRFGERMNRGVMTVTFGAVYFLFLPFLLIFVVPKNRLRIRKTREVESFWQPRDDKNDDIEQMMRMG